MSSSSTIDSNALIGALELGGTTIKVAISRVGSLTDVIEQKSFPTVSDPDTTLQNAIDYFQKNRVSAIGIGSFGPVDLDRRSSTYGCITSTPKPGWKGAAVLSKFRSFGVPLSFDTDVNAAAIGEIAYGQHAADGEIIDNCAYVTVGTGIGAGLVVGGRCVTGLMHPEAGHYKPPRHPKDTFKGNCPYHGDCLEGLSNAPAIAERLNIPQSALKSLSDDHPVWDIVGYYLAHLCSVLSMVASPQVIVLGGGVLQRKILFPIIRKHFLSLCNGYLQIKKITEQIDRYIVPSRFDAIGSKTSAGCIGVLELARIALEEEKQKQKTKRSNL